MTSAVVGGDEPSPLALLVEEGRFADAFRAFRNATDPRLATPEAGLYGALAAARMGRYADAFRLVTNSMDRLSPDADPATRIRGLLIQGGVALERGHLAEADAALTEAVELAREAGDELGQVRAWNNLGIVTHLRRHPLLALKLFRDALRLVVPMGMPVEEARVRHNLGQALREHGELNRAEREVTAAVALAEAMADPGLRGLVRIGAAELAMARGDLATARRNLDAARPLLRQAEDQHGEADLLRAEAALALAERRFSQAWPLARDARRQADRIGARVLVAECTALVALALHGMWKADEAEVEQEDAVRQAEAIGASRLADRLWERWAQRSAAG